MNSNQRYALMKRFISMLTCSILLQVAVGCAPITIKDKLPANVSKGYVEFYFLKSEGYIPFRFAIYSKVLGKRVLEGRTTAYQELVKDDKIGVRIAKRPGTYDFEVKVGNSTSRYVNQMRVEEGMVTPVKIKFGNIQVNTTFHYGGYSTAASFTMDLLKEEPRPLMPNETK